MIQRAIPIVLILAAVGIFFAYTNPTYTGEISESKLEVKTLDDALAAAESFKDRENQLERERLALSAEGLERLQAFLPDSVNNIQLILDLDELADRSGVQLSNFDVGESGEGEDGTGDDVGSIALSSTEAVESLEIMVTAVGSYSAFHTFLEAAEKSLRMLDIVSITVKSSNTGVYTYDITFRIYWLQ